MMKSTLTLLCFYLVISAFGQNQNTATFDNYSILSGDYLANSAPAGGFTSGNIFLPNYYDANFDAWTGWALSATTDSITPGFLNQYSAITGGGFDGSNVYAVGYAGFGLTFHLNNEAKLVEGLFITNSTYAYRSMLEGDAFAKKFGGEDGNDPDFFLLTVKKYLNGQLSLDSVDFYLADYRFSNNSQDYILKEWTYLDLSSLGEADSLWFSLSSSDVGVWGMNTPAYLCIENVNTSGASSLNSRTELQVEIFPNPAAVFLHINGQELAGATYSIINLMGNTVQSGSLSDRTNKINLLPELAGIYILAVEKKEARFRKSIVIQH